MPRYMLIVRENLDIERTQDELEELILKHKTWAMDLNAQGIFMDGSGLSYKGITLEKQDNELISKDIYYPEVAFGGYYIIQCDSFEQALEIARHCPTFDYGDKIEVRELI